LRQSQFWTPIPRLRGQYCKPNDSLRSFPCGTAGSALLRGSVLVFHPQAVSSRLNRHGWWHPNGRYIAVNLVDRAQVVLYEVIRDGDGSVSAVRPWGNRVQSNKFPFVGRFSPDGCYYITSDIQWGIDTKGFMV
jgi:hypothetical protein